jgi:UDP-glucose 4-epimerase
MTTSWIVTGGAGYIGAHVVDLFTKQGIEIIVIDSGQSGDFKRLNPSVEVIKCDVMDVEKILNLLGERHIEGLIHLAASKSVEESVKHPERYFRNNYQGSQAAFMLAEKLEIPNFIFSSTAAVYGESDAVNVNESAPLMPISPYGASKLEAEKWLSVACVEKNINLVILRYFNVAGTGHSSLTDFSRDNLIPRVLNWLLSGENPIIYGGDYPTRDGTAIRDYLHVSDLAYVHLLIAKRISSGTLPKIMNVGTGKGTTVLEVIRSVSAQLKLDTQPIYAPRREGDAIELLADSSLLYSAIGFRPDKGIDEIVRSLL